MRNNPLLFRPETPFDTHHFEEIHATHFLPAIREAVKIAKENVELIKKNRDEETYENVIEALENASPEVELISGVFFNLHSAETNDDIQSIAKEFSPLLSDFSNDISLDEELFKKVKKVWDKKDQLKIDTEQVMLLTKTYKGFVRNGALLNHTDKEKLREISKKLSTLSLHFGDNLLKEASSYLMVLESESELAGLPESAREAAAHLAEVKGHKGKWAVNLDYPSYVPFMTYSSNREYRQKLYMAMSTKGFKGNELDNKQLVKEIAQLRYEKAKLLGYSSHAHFVLEERMAKSPENVKSFLSKLLAHASDAAKKETEELKSFAKKVDGLEDFQKWDVAYYSEKLKIEKFSFDEEKLRPYFQLENVVEGVFKVANLLYGLNFSPRTDIPLYHPDVKTYEVTNDKGEHVAVFYADFFPRESKKNGAWMTSFRGQKIQFGVNVRPHISIVCNFTKPTPTKPSLLTLDEVLTLFHEFGHALHGMLANTRYETLSGTNVYWDFVELPSQIMENWVYEKECLDLFAKHYQTGEKIPQEYIEKIRAAANFLAGRMTLRQLSFGLIDMGWHSGDPSQISDIEKLEKELTQETDFLPWVAGTSTSCAFSHVFQGGYSAGYYSYKWAEVLDADAFEYFLEKGIFNKDTASKFKEHILSKGGSEHPMDLYLKFRGQEPNVDALLRRTGLI